MTLFGIDGANEECAMPLGGYGQLLYLLEPGGNHNNAVE